MSVPTASQYYQLIFLEMQQKILSEVEKRYGLVQGTVVEFFRDGKPIIQFDIDAIPSQIEYRQIDEKTFNIGDRVSLIKTGGTYILLGKLV